MRSPSILALALVLSAVPARPVALAAGAPAGARELRVFDPAQGPLTGPAWRPDALLLKLAPGATRLAAARDANTPVPTRLAGRSIGVARAQLGVAAVDAAAARLGGATFEPLFATRGDARVRPVEGLDGFYRVRLAPGTRLDDAVGAFGSLADVASAERIGVVPVSLVPNDSLFQFSTWFFQPSRLDVHAPEAWSIWTGDTSEVIGIMDTGVIPYHPDLGGTIAGLHGNLWVNAAEAGGVPGVDDDGNGKIDDVSGWDFVQSATFAPFPAGEDTEDEDPDPNDFAGHGTFVAGVAGALTDNLHGVAGTAPLCRLMPLRVGWSASIAPSGLVDMSYVAEAVVYGVQNGARVLNGSFETVSNSALAAAFAAAARAGVYVVLASGNNGGPNDESRAPYLITVAATDDADHVAPFSNLGSFVDVSAPGTSIRSTSLLSTGTDSLSRRTPDYSIGSGTSFAAPMVAGAVALWDSRERALGHPLLNPTNLALRLWDTADDISAVNPGVTGYGGGRLNLERLLSAPQVSRAFRGGARSVGPEVILHERSGVRVAWLAGNRALVISDANRGDTLALATLPGPPGRQLAAGDLGGGVVGLFAGTANARMCGFDLAGKPLPGWPYAAPSGFSQFTAGPALGDVDGDGHLDVASGSSDGNLWAWDRAGNLFDGFPFATSVSGLAGAVALADVDGQPGDEIVAASRDGQLHAVRFDGSEAAGFPLAVPGVAPSVSPVIGTLGGAPAIVVVGGTGCHAFRFDGSLLWNATLPGTVAQDPALADLDGDGSDEVLIPVSSPNLLVALDASGQPLTARGWPASLAAAPAGAPVVGPLVAGRPRCTLLLVGSEVRAIDDSAHVLASFAKPGGAGVAPSLDDVDADGRTEIAAGSGPDSLLYLYDAGASTWSASPVSWPTVRGDVARRGNRASPLALPVVDLTPPAAIADLAVDSIATTAIAFTWTAPGGDGALGRAARYEMNVTPVAAEAGTFRAGAVRSDLPPPDPANTPQRWRITGLAPGTSVFVAVRAIDSTGNVAPVSNVVHAVTPLGPPVHVTGPPLAPLAQPSRTSVRWAWRVEKGASPVAREIRLYDTQGRWLRTLELGAGDSGVEEWNGRDHEGRVVPAGIVFARLVSGSFHAQSRVVLLP